MTVLKDILIALLLAVSLCTDCLAISICSGVTMQGVSRRRVLYVSLVFALVHVTLLLAGYLLGDLFVGYVSKFAHLIGFLLLLYVGGAMVLGSLKERDEIRDLNGIYNILMASVATSIDALAVGVSLSMDMEPLGSIFLKMAVLFIVTVVTVAIGILGGRRIGRRFGRTAEMIGGLVLVGLGIGILI